MSPCFPVCCDYKSMTLIQESDLDTIHSLSAKFSPVLRALEYIFSSLKMCHIYVCVFRCGQDTEYFHHKNPHVSAHFSSLPCGQSFDSFSFHVSMCSHNLDPWVAHLEISLVHSLHKPNTLSKIENR